MSGLFERHSIEGTPDLERVVNLPRRVWSEQDLKALAIEMTSVLKTPHGAMLLRPLQALALRDVYMQRGLAALMVVGGGKTLVSLLSPHVVGAKRPVLFLPAALVDKTERERRELQKHWVGLGGVRMESYEMLGVERGSTFLTTYKPDMIILDEAQKVKNLKAGRTRRLYRYLRDNPDVIVVVMSGSFMKHGIEDYAHLIRWALKEGAPVPMLDGEVHEWGEALNEGVNPLARRGVGELIRLCSSQDLKNPRVVAARLGFQRRLIETPGVVASTNGSQDADCSLYVTGHAHPLPATIDPLFQNLRNMTTPDGRDLYMATEVSELAKEIAIGFHYVQVDSAKWALERPLLPAGPLYGNTRTYAALEKCRPPEPWRVARKLWAQFVRKTLKETEEWDTEKQVRNACSRGELPDTEYKAWMTVQATCTTETVAIWHDDTALKFCEKWMADGPGIVWVSHIQFGEELARRTGAKYYRQDGKDAQGEFIEDADPTKACIASVKSNKEGRNLQGRAGWEGFSRNLIVTMPAGADDIEQVLGRTHRSGQKADEVTVEVLIMCRENAEAWLKARAGAKAIRDMLGQPQKILNADVTGFLSPAGLDLMKGAQWNHTPEEFALPKFSSS